MTMDTVGIDVHPDYGVFLKDKSWVPAPRYVLRRYRLLKIFSSLKKGRALEIGCGAGGISFDLAQMGFTCEVLESSEQARDIAGRILSSALSPVHAKNRSKR